MNSFFVSWSYLNNSGISEGVIRQGQLTPSSVDLHNSSDDTQPHPIIVNDDDDDDDDDDNDNYNDDDMIIYS